MLGIAGRTSSISLVEPLKLGRAYSIGYPENDRAPITTLPSDLRGRNLEMLKRRVRIRKKFLDKNSTPAGGENLESLNNEKKLSLRMIAKGAGVRLASRVVVS